MCSDSTSHDSYTDSDSPELDPSNQNLLRILARLGCLRAHRPGRRVSSGSDDERPPARAQPSPERESSDTDLEQALAMSLEEERQRSERQRTEDEELERIIQDSIKTEAETAQILRFVHDRGELKSLLGELRGVDPNDPCFAQFFE
jgi:hypothetical protein